MLSLKAQRQRKGCSRYRSRRSERFRRLRARREELQSIHPGSHNASQLRREAYMKEKLDRKSAQQRVAVSIVKLMWFREHIDKDKNFYSHEEMLELVESYLHRLDNELETLDLRTKKRHTGCHYRLRHTSQEDAIRGIIVKERELFEGPGFEAPDLTNPNFFKTFLEWKGEEHLLSRIPLRKYREHSEHQLHSRVISNPLSEDDSNQTVTMESSLTSNVGSSEE